MFCCVVLSESTSSCTVVSRIASRSTSLTRSGWPRPRSRPAISSAITLIVFSHTLFSVLGGNTLASVASLTPGAVGVNQAFNVASLHEATTAATASAYSVGHQLLSTIWNVALAAVLVAFAFGRSGGKRLVLK
jgi:hypothetical protein